MRKIRLWLYKYFPRHSDMDVEVARMQGMSEGIKQYKELVRKIDRMAETMGLIKIDRMN